MLLFGPRLQWTDFFIHLINKKLIYKWSCVCTVSYIWRADNFALLLPWSFMLDSSVFCTDFATFAIIDIILETQRPQRKKIGHQRLQVSSFFTQLHKLPSQQRGSLFIWFHFRSSYMIYFIYICHIHLFHGNIYEVNTCMNVASSVQKVSYSKLLLNKSRCLNTMKSFLAFKVISSWIFVFFQKGFTMKLWQNTQFTTAILFCFIFTA